MRPPILLCLRGIMSTPLYDGIRKYAKGTKTRCHTPGHAGKARVLGMKRLEKLDVTEFQGLESLYADQGAIARAEELAACYFGAVKTCFSAGGNTLCIQTMLALVRERGAQIICSRNLHRSAVNAFALLDFSPVWLFEATPAQLKEQLAVESKAAAVLVTSPDYYGRMLDIPGLAAVCRHFDIPLLVDNAHGSHLRALDLHPLSGGACMVADSAHKTLPVLTGGAWLQFNDEHYAKKAKEAMSWFGSTSPSYPVMASLDLAREMLAQQGARDFVRLARRVDAIKAFAAACGIPALTGRVDPVRLTLNAAAAGLTGQEVAAHFRAKGIAIEHVDTDFAVLILTPFHTKRDFSRLKSAIKTLPKRPRGAREPEPVFAITPPEQMMSIRRALFGNREQISLPESVGRIAAQEVSLCPPGIPLVVPGEKLDEKMVSKGIKAGISEIFVVK